MGNTLKFLKKWWWLILLPLLLVLPIGKIENVTRSLFGKKGKPNMIKQVVDSLCTAMDNYGTDEDLMFNVLSGLSGNELKQVYEGFGVRPYFNGGYFIGGNMLDLFGWFHKELNNKEKTQMRDIWVKCNLELTF